MLNILIADRLTAASEPVPAKRYMKMMFGPEPSRPTRTFTSRMFRESFRAFAEEVHKRTPKAANHAAHDRSKARSRPNSTWRWCTFTAARCSGRTSGGRGSTRRRTGPSSRPVRRCRSFSARPTTRILRYRSIRYWSRSFLFMEARRYRYYEVWANRVRVLETGYFAPMLSHRTIPPDKEWADHISGRSDLAAFYDQRMGSGRPAAAGKLSLDIHTARAFLDAEDLHSSFPDTDDTAEDRPRYFGMSLQNVHASVLLRAGW